MSHQASGLQALRCLLVVPAACLRPDSALACLNQNCPFHPSKGASVHSAVWALVCLHAHLRRVSELPPLLPGAVSACLPTPAKAACPLPGLSQSQLFKLFISSKYNRHSAGKDMLSSGSSQSVTTLGSRGCPPPEPTVWCGPSSREAPLLVCFVFPPACVLNPCSLACFLTGVIRQCNGMFCVVCILYLCVCACYSVLCIV